MAEKYKLLVWLGVMFLLALGFDFKLPAQTAKKQQAQIDSMRKDIDTLQMQDAQKTRLLLDIKTLACLDHADQIVCQRR